MADIKNESLKIERLNQIISSIKSKPISEILSHHGVLFEKTSGRNKLALCPFHMNTRIGSFSVNDDKGICKCFSCGNGGDAIKFMMLTNDMEYVPATLQLAADEGIISKEEFESLSKTKYSNEFIKQMEDKAGQTSFRQRKADKPKEQISFETFVYDNLRLIANLSEEHYKHLKEIRHLSDEIIQPNYFTFRTNWKWKDIVLRELAKAVSNMYSIDTHEARIRISKVPGFYWDKTKNCLELIGYKGIGILIRDTSGNIRGVQIRRDSIKDGEQRYVWLTSSFAVTSNECDGGGSPGAPLDVIIPKEIKNAKKICVVEGRFKAEIMKEWGNPVISIQGVTNYNGLEKDIAEIEQYTGEKITELYVFYDGDRLRNMNVYAQAVKMGQYIKELRPDIEVLHCLWHEDLGKGIDDLVFANKLDDVKTFKQKPIEDFWIKAVESLTEESHLSRIDKMTKEQRIIFQEKLKTRLEEIFLAS